MPPVPKVELYAAIRRDARAGMPARAIERKYRVGRRTIIKALASAWPKPRKKPPRRASKLDPFKPAIDEMLRAGLDAPQAAAHDHAHLLPADRRAPDAGRVPGSGRIRPAVGTSDDLERRALAASDNG
jgi:hypothetical protein